MPGSQLKSKWADPNSVRSLVRRLLLEQAFGQWKRYAAAFALMAVAAGATALALLRRERTGEGSHVVVAQRDNIIGMIGEYIVAE